MNYKNYLKSDDWKQKKLKKFSKSGGAKSKCAICGSRERLEVHHLVYKNLYDVELKDLRILCKRCHSLTHKLFKEGKIRFKNKNPQSRFAIIKTAVKKELRISQVNMFKKIKKNEKNKLFHYKTYNFNLHEETIALLREKKKLSGKTWNLFFYNLFK